ncbi:hypothetical protein KHC23_11575 [Ancylobacter dichloromethanicus]|uniref:Gas vesicle protein C n=1 Tax=Ancylobacter dichloromethanicus TaxID=518825 RepID=A0A9W6J5V9_9HYPH|nr:hypothetical protein [Ancylobacter dichloromethanicus]MBS7554290.1 hypothetical protein [Ancylobacter dichloromethanicus]GLK71415.1 hypothetical protein GCM10017643_15300 [Ancylobacter dichloromethanicus]
MSLAGQISHTVATLASTREARHAALGGIRKDTTRHLGDAHAARRRMASEQQHRLSEALRTIKLSTAILLGQADERIDGYRKARIKQAARLYHDRSEGFAALRSSTRKWMGTQSAMRRKAEAADLRQRQLDRNALSAAVHESTTGNLAFLAALTGDRQAASGIWHGRVRSAPAAANAGKAPPEAPKQDAPKAEMLKVETVTLDATVPEVVAPPTAGPAKVEPAMPEVAKAEPLQGAPGKVAAPIAVDNKPTVAKGAGDKGSGEKSTSGKSA